LPIVIAPLLTLLAASGALALGLLRRRRAERLERERSRRAQLMYEAALRLSGTLESQEIYRGLRELAVRAIPCDGMIVSSFDPASSTVRCAYLWVNGQVLDHTTLPVLPIDLVKGSGMQTEVIRSGEGRLYADVQDRVRRGGRYFDVSRDGKVRDLSPRDSRPPGSRCALMVPIRLEGNVVGIVQTMSDTPGAYAQEHLSILESLVVPMAVALQNAELYARAHREITERMRVERALKASDERLREADKRKDEFLATLAHELRNPLAPIRTAVALLQADSPQHEHLPRGLSVIERQVGHMARLLDDLLDISRISRGTLPLRKERIEIADVVAHAVEASRPMIDAGRHELSVTLENEPIVFAADGTRLAQVLSNLLNNAARYSDSGSRIELTSRRQGDEVVIRVRDRGIGIAPDALPRIFEPFLPTDDVLERSRGGLGIGLSLVRKLVELHGGRVEAASEGPGTGSVFTVRLPLNVELPPAPPAARCASAPVGESARRRILVVDDVPDSADSLAALLERQGHQTRTAYDGADAVRVTREYRPNVVLLDLGLPGLNGYEAARQIRALEGTEPPLLIAITGWGYDENRERTREAGFSHHLVKPVDPAALMQLISSSEATRTM
jgi:signal transduction histidine kinase/ActR/RegA family two-component response regulator